MTYVLTSVLLLSTVLSGIVHVPFASEYFLTNLQMSLEKISFEVPTAVNTELSILAALCNRLGRAYQPRQLVLKGPEGASLQFRQLVTGLLFMHIVQSFESVFSHSRVLQLHQTSLFLEFSLLLL